MSDIGKPEFVTQKRVIQLFDKSLGYTYLGDRTDRPDNSNVEAPLLSAWLAKQGWSQKHITDAIYELQVEVSNKSRSLYENNRAVYQLLRYGVSVLVEAGKDRDTVPLIDWANPENNDFAIAEEVTLKGGHERRPDLVLYYTLPYRLSDL